MGLRFRVMPLVGHVSYLMLHALNGGPLQVVLLSYYVLDGSSGFSGEFGYNNCPAYTERSGQGRDGSLTRGPRSCRS